MAILTKKYLKEIIIEELQKINELTNRENAPSVRATASKYGMSLADASKADEIDSTLTGLALDKANLTPDEIADIAAKKGLAADKNILDKMIAASTKIASNIPAVSPTAKVAVSVSRLRNK